MNRERVVLPNQAYVARVLFEERTQIPVDPFGKWALKIGKLDDGDDRIVGPPVR
jgi:hypothetical protein